MTLGLVFAAVLVIGVILLALASMVYALGKQIVNLKAELAAIHRSDIEWMRLTIVTDLIARLQPPVEDEPPASTERLGGRTYTIDLPPNSGREAIHARLKSRGWTYKPPKGQKP